MPKNILIFGHRGKGPTSNLSKHQDEQGLGDVPLELQPENTLSSFKQAILEGADGIEFDIFISKDGIPMVIHDNELNRNISGAKRKENDLGNLESFTADELKKFDVGQGQSMPSLNEVINLISPYNSERVKNNLPPLILNVESKGINSASATMKVLNKAFEDNLIDKSSVMFCSFNHNALRELRKIDSTIKIAPAIKTTLLYGESNVDKDYKIREGASIDKVGLDQLENLHKEINCCAFDAVLWDVDKPLVELCIKLGIDLCASTSDFRAKPDDIGIAYNHFLVRMANMLDEHGLHLYFKSDEAGLMRQEIEKVDEAYNVPLGELNVMSTNLITNTTIEQKKRAHRADEEFKRLEKPKTPYSETFIKKR